jgi:hypothetical protein
MRPAVLASLGSCVLALLSAPGAWAWAGEASLSSGDNASLVKLVGWSRDERRIAFRVYSWLNGTYEAHQVDEARGEVPRGDAEEEEEREGPAMGQMCKGYVDHRGRPFRGWMELQVFEQRKLVRILPIQDGLFCTPPEELARRRAGVKQKLAEMGIDPRRPGSAFVLKPRGMRMEVKAGRRAPYTLEYVNATRVKRDEQEGNSRLQGALRLFLLKDGKRRKLFEHELDARFSSGSVYAVNLSHVFVSPSGERLVVLAYRRAENMRGVDEDTWITGVVDLASGVTVKGKRVKEKDEAPGETPSEGNARHEE